METQQSGGTVVQIRSYRTDDEEDVIDLWQRCGLLVPWNNHRDDIGRKLQFQPDLFLVGTHGDRVVATVMAGYEGHRGWINYLAVCPGLRRRGIGRQLMQAAEAALQHIGCPKINLQVRGSNEAAIGFYERLGFVKDDVVSLGKRLG